MKTPEKILNTKRGIKQEGIKTHIEYDEAIEAMNEYASQFNQEGIEKDELIKKYEELIMLLKAKMESDISLYGDMKYQHIKTGRIYKVISMCVINATNVDDGKIMALYEGMKRNGSGVGIFVRELNEFFEKFKPYNPIGETPTGETPTVDFPIPTVEEVQEKIVKSLSNSDWITRSSTIKMIDNVILRTLGSEADIKFWEGISDLLKQQEKS